jgi:hypothetical protein
MIPVILLGIEALTVGQLDTLFGDILAIQVVGTAVGLTRESLFDILARSKTRLLDPRFLQDFRETRFS